MNASIQSNALARLALMLSLVAVATAADAATLNWPGPAPCNGTLQACIDAAASGDTIELVGPSPIATNVVIANKSLTLRGRSNAGSTFSAGQTLGIVASGSASLTVVVEGLVFANGGVFVSQQSTATATVEIRRVRAFGTSFAPVHLDAIAGGQLNAVVENNDIEVSAGFAVTDGIAKYGSGPANLRVAFNRIRMVDTDGAGIWVGGNSQNVRARIYGNQIIGKNYAFGIAVSDSNSAGILTADVVSNVIREQGGNLKGLAAAITVFSFDGRVDAWVVHNTVVDNQNGIVVSGRPDLGAIVEGFVRNNLVAWNRDWGLFIEPDYAAAVPNRNNLVHGNASNTFTPGPGTVTTAPRLRPDRFRPYEGSPAIDAALDMTASLASLGLPVVDVDGQPRKNGANPDIGAFETDGTYHFLQRATSANSSAHITVIDWPFINARPSARTLFTPNWNPGGGPGTYKEPLDNSA